MFDDVKALVFDCQCSWCGYDIEMQDFVIKGNEIICLECYEY
nr:MAG TPA: zinc finger protein [Caudoviricetes sp.]